MIGAGRAGRGFALRCMRAGFEVVLEDVLPSKLRLAQEQLAQLANEVSAPGAISMASTVEEAVREADLAVDFVPNELESKLEIFSMIDRMAPPRTILCTPTDALSVTDLASCTYRSERCVGLRGDVAGDELALIHGRLTGPYAVEAVSEWLQRLGYNVSLLDDVEEPMLVKNLRTP